MLLHINCDVGESYYDKHVGHDEDVIPLSDALNVACGGHGGDPLTIVNAISLGLKCKKEIGAHPSYPDIVGFGRNYMAMSPESLSASLRYQIGAVKAITESLGGKMTHVKAHGALYNKAVLDAAEASVFLDVVFSIDTSLCIYAPHGSAMATLAADRGIKVFREGFADRRYLNDGTLAPRHLQGALITESCQVLEQIRLLQQGKAMTIGGQLVSMPSETFCIHGDQENAADILQAVDHEFRIKNEV